MASDEHAPLGLDAVGGSKRIALTLPASQNALLCPAKPRRSFDQSVEHSLQIERRAADDLEHVGGGGLLLQGLAQLVEQARVLDGDDGLIGEALEQLDLPVAEWADFLAVDADGSDQLVILEHWHNKEGAAARKLDLGDEQGIALQVGWFFGDIGDVHQLPCPGDTPKASTRAWTDYGIALPPFSPCGGRVVGCDQPKTIAFAEPQVAELCIANPNGILQHGVKDRFQFTL